MICSDRVIPSRNPMFHMSEIDLGEGRSMRDEFSIFMMKCVFDSCFFIRRMSLVSGAVCVHVILGLSLLRLGWLLSSL